RLEAAERALERIGIVPLGAASQAPREHRTMKGDELAVEREIAEDCREVAVADERFARTLRQLAVEQGQNLRAAVAAADADHAGDRWIVPRGVNGPGAHLRRAGHVALALEHRFVVHRLEPQIPDFIDAAIEFLAIERAGRSDDGEAIAEVERARLAHHRKRAISAAMARCSSRPSASRSAAPVIGFAATGDARKRSFARRWRISASSIRFIETLSSSTACTSASSAAACAS